MVDARLALRSRTDRAIQSAGADIVFALQGIAKEQVILIGCLPVERSVLSRSLSGAGAKPP